MPGTARHRGVSGEDMGFCWQATWSGWAPSGRWSGGFKDKGGGKRAVFKKFIFRKRKKSHLTFLIFLKAILSVEKTYVFFWTGREEQVKLWNWFFFSLFLAFITVKKTQLKHTISDISNHGTMLCRHTIEMVTKMRKLLTACPHGAYSLNPQIN